MNLLRKGGSISPLNSISPNTQGLFAVSSMAEHHRSISIFKTAGVKESISVSRERLQGERCDGVQNMWQTQVAKVHTSRSVRSIGLKLAQIELAKGVSR